ncbi:DNA polymerase III, epsilon subunit [Burkholderiales bacterium JOSHI_001]|nr:DNA polymerase III, epsilon subunit [Burkholderiales bacterium JOSHI_001]
MRQIFLDTETTGLSPENGDRVIELGCIEMENRRLTGNTLHLYFNPERKNHEDAVRVHGLTDEFLADKPLFAACVDEVVQFLEGAEIIIHNAAFDVGFLNEELRRVGRGPVTGIVAKVSDTLLMAREMFPGKSNSLDALCKRLEVDNSNRTLHGALLDAGLLAEVYIRLTRGQDSLVIDATESQGSGPQLELRDLLGLELPVIAPSAEELAAHARVLGELDKSSGGKTVWRSVLPAPGTAVA